MLVFGSVGFCTIFQLAIPPDTYGNFKGRVFDAIIYSIYFCAGLLIGWEILTNFNYFDIHLYKQQALIRAIGFMLSYFLILVIIFIVGVSKINFEKQWDNRACK